MPNLPYPYLDQSEFPAIPAALVAALQGNFDALANGQINTGGRSIKFRYGSGTVTVATAAGVSAGTISHGLGSTPVAVFTATTASLTDYSLASSTRNAGATTFELIVRRVFATTTSEDHTFYWLAIG